MPGMTRYRSRVFRLPASLARIPQRAVCVAFPTQQYFQATYICQHLPEWHNMIQIIWFPLW